MIDVQTKDATKIRLTALSHGAGCACKLGSAELTEVLRHLPDVDDPRVLVDASSRDDAAVFLLSPDRALIATTDFFTPIVDDAAELGRHRRRQRPERRLRHGRHAALCAQPGGVAPHRAPLRVAGRGAGRSRRGGQEAGCLLLGGHSIDDAEPKFGLAVTGEAHPDHLMTNAAGKAGDYLVLTKPLGTGLLTTALKRDRLAEPDLHEAVTRHAHPQRRGRPRRPPGRRPLPPPTSPASASSATSATSSGAAQLAAELWMDNVPVLEHARQMAEEGMVPGGTARNLDDGGGDHPFRRRRDPRRAGAAGRRADVRRAAAGSGGGAPRRS